AVRRGSQDDHTLGAPGRFDILLGELAAIPNATQHGVHRDVDVHVRIADAEPLDRIATDPPIRQDTHHRQPHAADFDLATNRRILADESGTDPVADDRYRQAMLHLQHRELMPLHQIKIQDPEVGSIHSDHLATALEAVPDK